MTFRPHGPILDRAERALDGAFARSSRALGTVIRQGETFEAGSEAPSVRERAELEPRNWEVRFEIGDWKRWSWRRGIWDERPHLTGGASSI